jgi:hypothetical protein
MAGITVGIRRKNSDTEPLGFAALRREGLALVQQYAGDRWTDYNVHDPGVTILEHVCYALTDLIYRTTFPLQDFLTDDRGIIEWRRLALYPPQEILTSGATTVSDLRKVLLDLVPEIDNVWVKQADAAKRDGLYRVEFRLSPDVLPDRAASVAQLVEDVYRAHRNLCEDVAAIVAPVEVEYDLEAAVEVSGLADPAEVVAEIYRGCARHISTGVSFGTFEAALAAGPVLEDLFDGPLTRHGIVRRQELHAEPDDDRTDLFAIVRSVPGVEQVRRLNVRRRDAEAARVSESGGRPALPRLHIPERDGDIRVKLFRGTMELPVSTSAVIANYRKISFRDKELRQTGQDVAALTRIADGHVRPFHRYSSIQNDLPPQYGINAFGLPATAPPDEHARALQLKAYLLLFDQVMANFASNLQNWRRLLSFEEDGRSYVATVLDGSAIPGVDALYTELPGKIAEDVLWEKYDRYKRTDRRSRLLDYQLALYGETFSQISLRQFDPYRSGDDLDEAIVRNKAALLADIVAIGRDRAAGFDDRQPAWNTDNVSGLARKVSILLGVRSVRERSLTDVFTDAGLDIVPDADLAELPEHVITPEHADLGDMSESGGEPRTEYNEEVVRKLFGDVAFLRANVVGESILRHGVSRSHYSIGRSADRASHYVAIDHAPGAQRTGRWRIVSSHPTKREALHAAAALRRFLTDLNVDSEGLHVVEHILLRPQASRSGLTTLDDFYPFRISVVFPSWTARFNDLQFQKLAESIVRLSCPAHVFPSFYWLGFPKMREFESLYQRWLQQRQDRRAPDEGLDDAAQGLVAFLRANTPSPPSGAGR